MEVDAGELELAILNLCVNARDAMPNGGMITIAAENVDRGEALASSSGFPSPTPASACRPKCRRARSSRSSRPRTSSKGSGLGLPQVYGFAQQSGGRVSVESTVGAGTTVTLLLPRSLEAQRRARPRRRRVG